MIVKLDRFFQPVEDAAVSIKDESATTATERSPDAKNEVDAFIKQHLLGPVLDPYFFVFIGIIGFLILLQIVSTVLLTFIVCHLLDTCDVPI